MRWKRLRALYAQCNSAEDLAVLHAEQKRAASRPPLLPRSRVLPAGLCHSPDYEHPLVLPQLRHL